jgi:hypothetical protein
MVALRQQPARTPARRAAVDAAAPPPARSAGLAHYQVQLPPPAQGAACAPAVLRQRAQPCCAGCQGPHSAHVSAPGCAPQRGRAPRMRAPGDRRSGSPAERAACQGCGARRSAGARLVPQRPAARLALLAPAGHVEERVRLQQRVAVERGRRRLQHRLPATASRIMCFFGGKPAQVWADARREVCRRGACCGSGGGGTEWPASRSHQARWTRPPESQTCGRQEACDAALAEGHRHAVPTPLLARARPHDEARGSRRRLVGVRRGGARPPGG